MSADELDGPVSRALEALEPVSARDLIGAARALEESRRDSLGLFRFAGVFRAFAHDRRLGGDPSSARLQLCTAVIQARPELADRLADAPEPFWRHVREALRAHQASIQG